MKHGFFLLHVKVPLVVNTVEFKFELIAFSPVFTYQPINN